MSPISGGKTMASSSSWNKVPCPVLILMVLLRLVERGVEDYVSLNLVISLMQVCLGRAIRGYTSCIQVQVSIDDVWPVSGLSGNVRDLCSPTPYGRTQDVVQAISDVFFSRTESAKWVAFDDEVYINEFLAVGSTSSWISTNLFRQNGSPKVATRFAHNAPLMDA